MAPSRAARSPSLPKGNSKSPSRVSISKFWIVVSFFLVSTVFYNVWNLPLSSFVSVDSRIIKWRSVAVRNDSGINNVVSPSTHISDSTTVHNPQASSDGAENRINDEIPSEERQVVAETAFHNTDSENADDDDDMTDDADDTVLEVEEKAGSVLSINDKSFAEATAHTDDDKEESEQITGEDMEEEYQKSTTPNLHSLPESAEMLSKLSTRSYDVCIVGAGLSGAVIAERYASQLGKKVLIMEKRNHTGGNCYDFIDQEVGLRVSKYGAHLFHTKHERVWNYVQQFAEWTPYEHKVIGVVNNIHVPIPVNIETVNKLFGLNITSVEEMDQWLEAEQVHYGHEPQNAEEVALSRVGPRLYDLIFKPYTMKQWDREPKELGPEVTARIPVRNNFDGRYFSDPRQALPKDGYTSIFERMFQHQNIEVHTGVDYFAVREALTCERTYYTGPIDTYFLHLGWEKLQYRSIDFERKVEENDGFFQPAFVVNHPYASANFTRIVEYKHLPNQPESKKTVYFIERSTDTGEPYYPVPNKRNKDLYAKYQAMALKEPNVTFAGRLANYKYFNMDEAILNALQLFDSDTGSIATVA